MAIAMFGRRSTGDPFEWLLGQLVRLVRFVLPGRPGRMLAGLALVVGIAGFAVLYTVRDYVAISGWVSRLYQ